MTRVSGSVAEMFAKHELTQVGSDPETYYLHEPGGMVEGRLVRRMQSTLLVFTKEGIVIMGDLCPGRNGVISSYGYGVEWFSGRLTEEYLCSKFLDQGLHVDGFSAWIEGRLVDEKEALKEAETEGDTEARDRSVRNTGLLKEALTNLSDEYIDVTRDELLTALGEYHGDGQGYDYDTRESGHLCAIQQRFATLYQAMKAAPRPSAIALPGGGEHVPLEVL